MIFRVNIKRKMPERVIFIDRDGTLIRDDGYLDDPEGIHEIGCSSESLKILAEKNWALFIVSNQAGLAKGIITRDQFDEVRRRFEALFDPAGELFDGVFYCPHHRDGMVPPLRKDCRCRKPGPLMVETALSFLVTVPPAKDIFVVGDKLTDVLLGKGSGFTTIMTMTGYGKEEMKNIDESNLLPDYLVKDFDEAVYLLTKRAGKAER